MVREFTAALPEMNECLAMFDDDYVTREMIQTFIIDEQEHYNWVKRHLCIIEQIGIENYLIEQRGDEDTYCFSAACPEVFRTCSLVFWEHGGMTEKELGGKVHLDSGTLTPLLKRLEKQGLVKRR